MSSLPAFAFEATAFNAAPFETAQAAGKPILLEIAAPRRPTSKAQKLTRDAVHPVDRLVASLVR